jgi:hypothetical protein
LKTNNHYPLVTNEGEKKLLIATNNGEFEIYLNECLYCKNIFLPLGLESNNYSKASNLINSVCELVYN